MMLCAFVQLGCEIPFTDGATIAPALEGDLERPGQPLEWTGEDETIEALGAAYGTRVAASSFGDACQGYLPEDAQHLLHVRSQEPLRIIARGEADLVMVVHGRGGTYCSDDFEGLAPGFQLQPPVGEYLVYVGTRRPRASGNRQRYRMELSPAALGTAIFGLPTSRLEDEIASLGDLSYDQTRARRERLEDELRKDESTAYETPPGPVPRAELSARQGTHRVDLADEAPLSLSVSAGGRSALWQLVGPCAGRVDARGPDLRLRVSNGASKMMELSTKADDDLTLAVRLPSGEWRCDDDSGRGRMPKVQVFNPRDGDYLVWLGTARAGDPVAAELIVRVP